MQGIDQVDLLKMLRLFEMLKRQLKFWDSAISDSHR